MAKPREVNDRRTRRKADAKATERLAYHVIIEGGEPKVICDTPRKRERYLSGLLYSMKTGKELAPSHRDIQTLVRSRFAAKNVTIDDMIDTLENARNTARNRDGDPDHRVRMDAVKIELNMMGITGESARAGVEESAASHAAFTSEEIKGKSKDEIVASVLRKLRAAQSNGLFTEEDIEIRPEQVEILAKYSRSAVGDTEIRGDLSITTRPSTKVDHSKLSDVLAPAEQTYTDQSAEALFEEIA